MAVKRLTEDEKIQLVDWCRNGENYEEIAKKSGVTGKVIRDWIIKLAPDLISMRANNNQDKINAVIKLYCEGGTYQNIAYTVGVSKSTVIKWIKTHASDKLQENKNKFSQDVKNSAMELMRTHLNYTKVGEMLNLHPTTIRDWVLSTEPNLAILAKQKNPLLDNAEEIIKQFDNGVAISDIAKNFSIGEKSIRVLLNRERPKSALIQSAITLCKQGLNYEEVAKQLGKTGKTIGDWMRSYAPNLAKERANLNAQKVEEIIKLLSNGVTEDEVAKHMGLHVGLIKRCICQNTTKINNDLDVIKAIELCESGLTYVQIAVELNRKPSTVRGWIIKNKPSLSKATGYNIASNETKQQSITMFLEGKDFADIEKEVGFPIYVIKRWISKIYPDMLPKKKIAVSEDDIPQVIALLQAKERTYQEIGALINCSGNAIRDFAIKNQLQHTLSEMCAYKASIGMNNPNTVKTKICTQYGTLACDSTYELAKVLELMDNPNVVNIQRCKRISLGNGRNYVPDFQVTYANGDVEIIEVKAYWNSQSESVLYKQSMALKHFIALGMRYNLITERDISQQFFQQLLELLQNNCNFITFNNPDNKLRLIRSTSRALSECNRTDVITSKKDTKALEDLLFTPRAPAKRLKITNGIDNRMVLTEADIPTGWHKGVTRTDAGTSMNITDGMQTKRIKKDEPIPDGWWKGRHNSGGANADSFWITNGIDNQKITNIADLPDGWCVGMTNNKNKNLRGITNDVENKRIPYNQPLPSGWKWGVTKGLKHDTN